MAGQLVEPAAQRDPGRADVAPLVGEGAHGDAPAAVEGSEQRVGRQPHLGRGTPRRTRCRRSSGAAVAPRCPARACRRGRTRCPRGAAAVGVRAGQEDAPVGDPPVGAPHLRAGDDPAVAVALGPRGSEARSLPASGSENSWHQTWSARRMPGRCSACCSGVPKARSEPPVSTRPTMLIQGGTWARAHSRTQAAVCSGSGPARGARLGPVDAGPARLEERRAARPGPPPRAPGGRIAP